MEILRKITVLLLVLTLNYPLQQKSGLLIFFVKALVVFKFNIFEGISFHIFTLTNLMLRLMAKDGSLLGRNKF